MATYTYKIDIYLQQQPGVTYEVHHTATGEVEAERYSHACTESWPLIHEECEQLRQETGGRTGVGDLRVERKQSA